MFNLFVENFTLHISCLKLLHISITRPSIFVQVMIQISGNPHFTKTKRPFWNFFTNNSVFTISLNSAISITSARCHQSYLHSYTRKKLFSSSWIKLFVYRSTKKYIKWKKKILLPVFHVEEVACNCKKRIIR